MKCFLRLAVLGTVVCLALPASAQILRPTSDDGGEILRVARVAELELDLPVDAETAYDAWTVVTELVEWLPHWADMTVDVDSGFSMGWDGYDGVWTGTYLEVERPERLVFTWVVPEGVFPSGSYETTVSVTFEETDEGRTTMLLEHRGFRDAAEMESQLLSWRGYMFALRAHLLRATR
ncbi:MAG: hypothetical protein GKS06_10520 [Acidobacteria bacterium]|nr:hypothetical protein [Acidobacteriota bacterium]